jgi:hypothetical protein
VATDRHRRHFRHWLFGDWKSNDCWVHRCDGITDKIGAVLRAREGLVADTLGAAMSGTVIALAPREPDIINTSVERPKPTSEAKPNCFADSAPAAPDMKADVTKAHTLYRVTSYSKNAVRRSSSWMATQPIPLPKSNGFVATSKQPAAQAFEHRTAHVTASTCFGASRPPICRSQ